MAVSQVKKDMAKVRSVRTDEAIVRAAHPVSIGCTVPCIGTVKPLPQFGVQEAAGRRATPISRLERW
jgi:hypothetical protein